jgi:hypothetical protein
MTRWKKAMFVVMIVVTVEGAAPFAASGAPPACAPPHRLRILDLGMIPDPVYQVYQGKSIQQWKVTLESGYSADCLTALEVLEGDQSASTQVPYQITPGRAHYTLQADRRYQFRAQDVCFQVAVNVQNTRTLIAPLDPQKRFCARYRPQPPPGSWSLK